MATDESTTSDPNERGEAPEATSSVSDDVQSWQERLLPLMVWMVVGLTLFFFIASFAQLAYLHVSIQQAPKVNLDEQLAVPGNVQSVEKAREFNLLARLEASTLRHRYHQANVFLMSRVWARYLGFVTGMILALVGAAFILGKLREQPTELSAEGMGGMLNLRSASPGIVLAVLGVTLMITTIVTHHSIRTANSPVYVRLAVDEKPKIDQDTAGEEKSGEPADTNLQ